jgi:prepilin-type N-terminal cleavage/methylation domain-containing protein
MRTRGFSIIELMVVIVIIGILATLSISNMRTPLERGRAKNAEFNLLSIYSAQKRYLLSERQYFLCNTTTAKADKVFEITRTLPIKIEDAYFDYDVVAYGASGYKAIAIRKDGLCADKQINLTSENSTVDKRGCDVW